MDYFFANVNHEGFCTVCKLDVGESCKKKKKSAFSKKVHCSKG